MLQGHSTTSVLEIGRGGRGRGHGTCLVLNGHRHVGSMVEDGRPRPKFAAGLSKQEFQEKQHPTSEPPEEHQSQNAWLSAYHDSHRRCDMVAAVQLQLSSGGSCKACATLQDTGPGSKCESGRYSVRKSRKYHSQTRSFDLKLERICADLRDYMRRDPLRESCETWGFYVG